MRRTEVDHGHNDLVSSIATFNKGNTYLPRQRTSSFAAIPAYLYTPSGNPLRHIRHVVPKPIAVFCKDEIPSHESRTGAKTPTKQGGSSSLKAALLADGFGDAFLHAVIAILINHIRNILVPWLGAFTFFNPMEDLRLARSNPDVFLDQTLSYSWTWVCGSYLQTVILDLFAVQMIRVLSANNGHLPQSTLRRFRASPKAVTVTLEGLMHLCRISYEVYLLITLDYIFAQTVHTASCTIAIYNLTTGAEAGHRALIQVLLTHWIEVPLQAGMLWYHIQYALLPSLSGAVSSASRGRPGLLLTLMGVAGGVAATLKWRARLYILLEMSPMFVVLGEVVAVAVVLVREYVIDILRARASGGTKVRVKVKGSVPVGAKRFPGEMGGSRNATKLKNNNMIR